MPSRAHVEDPVAVAERTLVHLRRVYQAIHHQSAALEESAGVTSPQLWALRAVAEEADGLTLGALAKKLVLHKANAGRIIDRLKDKKLVATATPDHDRRVVIVTATARGRTLLAKSSARPAQVVLLEKLAALPARDLKTIEHSVATLVALLGAEDVSAGLIARETRPS